MLGSAVVAYVDKLHLKAFPLASAPDLLSHNDNEAPGPLLNL